MVDILTKGLPSDRFLFMCGKLGIKLSSMHVTSNDSTGIPKIKNSSSVESSLKGGMWKHVVFE